MVTDPQNQPIKTRIYPVRVPAWTVFMQAAALQEVPKQITHVMCSANHTCYPNRSFNSIHFRDISGKINKTVILWNRFNMCFYIIFGSLPSCVATNNVSAVSS